MPEDTLTLEEKDVIGELGNISMGAAATALSTILGRRVEITVPRVEVINKEEVADLLPEEHIVVKVRYQEGLEGENLLLIKEEDARILVSLMMGGGDTEAPLGEMEISALGEAMNQMMGSAATAMSEFLRRKISISPPEIIEQEVQAIKEKWLEGQEEEYLVEVFFHLVVDDAIDSNMIQLLPLSFSRAIVSSLAIKRQESIPPEEESLVTESSPKQEKKEVKAQSVEFAEFKKKEEVPSRVNIQLIMDVNLPLVVELGRTQLSIREILDLGPGSIVELDKLAGEPADLYINDVLFARGEVVVIEENFGVRITEIVSPEDRIKNLKEARI
ncbi:MAG TPA: flagellar motor switch phosphatase FliY [Candidatus Atribacteria bacterium]|nr:flagellar motor switch phosphatase FliY [Candidatus Atribacteria bacterium]